MAAVAVAVPVVGAVAYWLPGVLNVGQKEKELSVDVKAISDDVFDTEDNLFVFFLSGPEELEERLQDMHRIVRALLPQESFKRLRYYYNIRQEGDPSVPEAPGIPGALRVVMYKGQRRKVVSVGTDIPMQQIADFFSPVSEEVPKALGRALDVPKVYGICFERDVVDASSPGHPILVQLYEDTCFLCFLMRPFVNSIARLFATNDVPLTIKRLNIEHNDFPDLCPVARGTPTFVLYRGPGQPAVKYDEFKPKDLCERLSQDFPHLREDVLAQMEELQAMVSKRFMLFTQTVMWNVEMQKLEDCLNGKTEQPELSGQDPSEDGFNTVVSQMMARDMKRTDDIVSNLKYLQQEVDDVEQDAIILGVKLAEVVAKREREWEVSLSRGR